MHIQIQFIDGSMLRMEYKLDQPGVPGKSNWTHLTDAMKHRAMYEDGPNYLINTRHIIQAKLVFSEEGEFTCTRT